MERRQGGTFARTDKREDNNGYASREFGHWLRHQKPYRPSVGKTYVRCLATRRFSIFLANVFLRIFGPGRPPHPSKTNR